MEPTGSTEEMDHAKKKTAGQRMAIAFTQPWYGKDFLIYLAFVPEGRLNRKRFFQGHFIAFAAVLVAVFSSGGPLFGELIQGLVTTVFYIASFFMAIKRFHDLGNSGWLALLILVPVINFFVYLYLLFARGMYGENAYGPDPLAWW
ncbi:MAG: DUF805 domain-containing protein [bacterium]|nr:DUF805 domain-containing protein [bacterium]